MKTTLNGQVAQFYLCYSTGYDGYARVDSGPDRKYDDPIIIKPYGNRIRVSIPYYWQDNAGEDHKRELKHYYVTPDDIKAERHTYYGGGGYNYWIILRGEDFNVHFMDSAPHGTMPDFSCISVDGERRKKKNEMEPGFVYGEWVRDRDHGWKRFYTCFEPDKAAAAWLIDLYNQYAKDDEKITEA